MTTKRMGFYSSVTKLALLFLGLATELVLAKDEEVPEGSIAGQLVGKELLT